MLNALYMSSMNGQELTVGNETVFMYDRGSLCSSHTSHATSFRRSTIDSHPHSTPRIQHFYITRPCDRSLSIFQPYNWHHYSYIPNVFRIRVERMRKVYGAEDYSGNKGSRTGRGTWHVLTDTVFQKFLFFDDEHGKVESSNLPVVQLSQETSEFLKKRALL
ncbi:MAG: hypothetical protein LUI87_17965 [Lachnospiraceae bacterium]|nr:hypothetical protein [Lachnospiraceae bacterium]